MNSHLSESNCTESDAPKPNICIKEVFPLVLERAAVFKRDFDKLIDTIKQQNQEMRAENKRVKNNTDLVEMLTKSLPYLYRRDK